MKINIDADTLHLLKEAVTDDHRQWLVCVDDGKGKVHAQIHCSPIFLQLSAKELENTANEELDKMPEDDIDSMVAGFLMKAINQALKDEGKDDESNQIHYTAGK